MLEKLEYDKVLKMLARKSVTPLAAEAILKFKPVYRLDEVVALQEQTVQAYEILRLHPTFTLNRFHDIEPFIKRAKLGISLAPECFLEIAMTISSGQQVEKFLDPFVESYEIINAQTKRIVDQQRLLKQINETITSDAKIASSATSRLRSIGKAIVDCQEKIKNKLQGMIHSISLQKKLQDQIITIRNDRYVIPIKHEYAASFSGLVHDQSASGATVFIEPMSVVDLNNKLKQLFAQKKAEEERILHELSAEVALVSFELEELLDALTKLDIFFAKAKFANKIRGTKPLLNDMKHIKLIEARHPLIPEGEVVPIDFWLTKETTMVVITGPNTGGKTVALKTIGLLTLMAMTGLFIPACEESSIAIVDGIYVDIGDEQSIEQSLSTFSSHLTNVVRLLSKATDKSLVLLDELGAGTDPIEGAALARAILEHIHSIGTITIATTHYGALKHFAYNTAGVENASVEFDVTTLKPTYKLLMGIPGRSNAFEISARLGLEEQIIERGKDLMEDQEVEIGNLIQNLEEKRNKLEQELQFLQNEKLNVEYLKEDVERQRLELEERQHKAIDDIVKEAKRMLKNVKFETKDIIKGLHTAKEVHEARQRINLLEKEISVHERIDYPIMSGDVPSELKLGDKVLLPRLNQKGEVLQDPNESGEVLLQVGIMKISANIKDLRILNLNNSESEKNENYQGVVSLVSSKSQSISPELDLRGQTAHDALKRIEKYLDDAIITGLNQVSLIHGKGTGALAKAVQDYLKNHPQVASYRFGMHGEGGHGVTVVRLK